VPERHRTPGSDPQSLGNLRRTKIVASLGPATQEPEVLDQIIDAGIDVARFNYSHGTHEDHKSRMTCLQERARAKRAVVGTMADLGGPKIRIKAFREGKIFLEEGDDFTLDADLTRNAGDSGHVGVTHKDLPKDVKPGDTLLLDDGRIILQVEKVVGNCVETVVLMGGELSSNKGLNRQGGGLSAKALTRKDFADLKHACEMGMDYIAVSFPRNADDIVSARKALKQLDARCGVIAKIERAEAVEAIEEIMAVSDGIMIARGDLGVELGDAALPAVQKRLIRLARDRNSLVITATQMMQSMIESPIPTRAEVFDVANAVLDGTDAVMLSAETSVGHHPVRVVKAMARICAETEAHQGAKGSDYRLDSHFQRIDEAIAMSTMYAANHIGAQAIAALTETGSTTLWMSRVNSAIPIFAFTRSENTSRRVTMFRGVYPIDFDITHTDYLEANKEMLNILKSRGAVADGDAVIITKGDLGGQRGGTNIMKIVRVGQLVEHRA
jgi:pyruvate kinase